MSQFSGGQVRRKSGELNVYTGLLLVATIVLAAGVTLLAMENIAHSEHEGSPGGVLTLVEDS